tara:strand:+ start:128 stop:274 length:147 start_codon:yes stop_codon:yes gene_type:complete
MKKKIPKYLSKLLKLYPKITSGRKNYNKTNTRIEENIILTKKYLKKKY